MKALLAGAAGLALAGCDDAVTGSVLAGPRVIAIAADPPAIRLDASASLRVTAAIDGRPVTDPLAIAWRACDPTSVVVDPTRDCAGDRGLSLAARPDGSAVLDAAALIAFGVPPGLDDAAADPCGRVVAPVVVVADVDLDGAVLTAIKDVSIGPDPPPRTNPRITEILADGAPVADGAVLALGAVHRVSVRLAPDELDLVCRDGDAPTELETATAYILASGGAEVRPGTFGIEYTTAGSVTAGEVELTVPDVPQSFGLWVVIVDETGGSATAFRDLRAGT